MEMRKRKWKWSSLDKPRVDTVRGLQLTWNTGARKSLNKEQTTAPQVHYKPWCGLL